MLTVGQRSAPIWILHGSHGVCPVRMALARQQRANACTGYHREVGGERGVSGGCEGTGGGGRRHQTRSRGREAYAEDGLKRRSDGERDASPEDVKETGDQGPLPRLAEAAPRVTRDVAISIKRTRRLLPCQESQPCSATISSGRDAQPSPTPGVEDARCAVRGGTWIYVETAANSMYR